MTLRLLSPVALAILASALLPDAARGVEPATLADSVRAELQQRGVPGAFRIELGALPPALAADSGPAHLAALQLEARSGRLAASFIHGAGHTTTVAGRMIELKEVPVLRRTLERGEQVAAGDLEWIEVPAARAGPGIATDLTRLIGAEARRTLRAGEPLRGADLRAPLLVRKGGLVMLTYATGTMHLTLTGRALAEGGQGDVIRVLNIQSSRIVEAAIDGKDSAIVRAPNRPALQ